MNHHGSDNLMQSEAPNPAAGIDHDLFLRCVHCGLCTSSCPTFTEVGDENDGPRGRIQIMRMVAEWRTALSDHMRRHLELCLDCRSCETACPSGVQYGRLIEPFRLAFKQSRRADRGEVRLVPRVDPLPLVPLCRAHAKAAGARAVGAADGTVWIWPSEWGS